MQVTLKVIHYTVHENVGQPGITIHQAKLYGVHNDHGVLLELAQPNNDLGLAMDKEFTVTVEPVG